MILLGMEVEASIACNMARSGGCSGLVLRIEVKSAVSTLKPGEVSIGCHTRLYKSLGYLVQLKNRVSIQSYGGIHVSECTLPKMTDRKLAAYPKMGSVAPYMYRNALCHATSVLMPAYIPSGIGQSSKVDINGY